MKKVIVHIDRLVLHGMEKRSGADLSEALRDELVRVLSGKGAFGRDLEGASVEQLSPGKLAVRQETGVQDVGVSVARAIARRIKQ
jgi:hypothetical protein